MARGQSGAATNQLNLTNSVAGQEGAQSQALESNLIPGYESLMDTGYMNPAEENAATTSEMGSATAPFQSAEFKAANRAGATKNAAALPAEQDALALEEGQASGNAAADLQKQKLQGQELGMSGESGLEEGNLRAMEEAYGLGPGTLQARAAGPSWTQGFQQFSQGLNQDVQAGQGIGSMMASGGGGG
jgi:hypothetical protein